MNGNLPVLRITRHAYASLVSQWRLLAAIAAPIIVFHAVAHEIISPFGHSGLDSPQKVLAWLFVEVASVYLDVVLALTWLRSVVLQPPRPEVLFASFGQIWRFFTYGLLYAVLVWALPLAVIMKVQAGVDDESVRGEDLLVTHPWLMLGVAVAVFCISTLFIARVGLVFPATALDRAIGLRAAWRKSTGIFWRFVAIVTLCDLPFDVIGAGFDVLKIGAGNVAYTALSVSETVIDYLGFLILLAAIAQVYAWGHSLQRDDKARAQVRTQT